MREVFEIIKQIQANSSRNDKEAILAANKDNQQLRMLLNNVFNPYIIFGIKDKKLNKFLKTAKGIHPKFNRLEDLFEYLQVNNTGTDAVVKEVAEFLMAEFDEDIRNFMYDCVTKKLKIGATAKSINKSFGEQLIPEFNVMLAKKFEDHEHRIKGKFFITEKLDGMRVIMVVEHNEIKFFSRQGQPVLGLTEITQATKQLPDNVYDGELLIHNADDYKDRDVLQETLKIARKDGEKKGLVLHLFDVLPVEEFMNGKSKKKYIDRKHELVSIVEELNSPFIKYVPCLYIGEDKNVIPELLAEMDNQGKEGLMLNTNSYYETKRSSNLLKIKTMNEVDLKITGYEEGTGKYIGMLGAFIVDYKGYSLRVGSGYLDDERVSLWQRRDELVRDKRVITVQYFRESKNANGGLSVSFPVFKQLRERGKEVSYH